MPWKGTETIFKGIGSKSILNFPNRVKHCPLEKNRTPKKCLEYRKKLRKVVSVLTVTGIIRECV